MYEYMCGLWMQWISVVYCILVSGPRCVYVVGAGGRWTSFSLSYWY